MMNMMFPQGTDIPNQQQMMMNPYMFMSPYYMMMMQQMQGVDPTKQNYGMDPKYMNFPNPQQQMMMYNNMMSQGYFPGMGGEDLSKNMGSMGNNMYGPNNGY